MVLELQALLAVRVLLFTLVTLFLLLLLFFRCLVFLTLFMFIDSPLWRVFDQVAIFVNTGPLSVVSTSNALCWIQMIYLWQAILDVNHPLRIEHVALGCKLVHRFLVLELDQRGKDKQHIAAFVHDG
jgi:hypothetical protein